MTRDELLTAIIEVVEDAVDEISKSDDGYPYKEITAIELWAFTDISLLVERYKRCMTETEN